MALKMSNLIIGFEELKTLCRPYGPRPRLKTVCQWAEKQGIRYKWDSSGGIWTTVEAVNSAVMQRDQNKLTPTEDLI